MLISGRDEIKVKLNIIICFDDRTWILNIFILFPYSCVSNRCRVSSIIARYQIRILIFDLLFIIAIWYSVHGFTVYTITTNKKQLTECVCICWESIAWIFDVYFLKWLSRRWTDSEPAWPLLQVLKKDSQEFVARSYWDVLRRSASQVLFSDLAEVHWSNCPLSLHPSIFHPSLFPLSSL